MVVADRVGVAAELFAQSGEVVVRVREVRVERECLLVVDSGGGRVAGVVQRESQIEVDDGVVGTARERDLVETDGFGRVAGLVLEPAEVDVGVDLPASGMSPS